MDDIDLQKFRELVEGLQDTDSIYLRFMRDAHHNPWYARIDTGRQNEFYISTGHTLAEISVKLMQQTGTKARAE